MIPELCQVCPTPHPQTNHTQVKALVFWSALLFGLLPLPPDDREWPGSAMTQRSAGDIAQQGPAPLSAAVSTELVLGPGTWTALEVGRKELAILSMSPLGRTWASPELILPLYPPPSKGPLPHYVRHLVLRRSQRRLPSKALTSFCSQVESNVAVQEMIFLEFFFIVEVIDFIFLQVTRNLSSPIPLITLDGYKVYIKAGTSLPGTQGNQCLSSVLLNFIAVTLTSCRLASRVQT